MINSEELDIIKITTQEFLDKMSIKDFTVDAKSFSEQPEGKELQEMIDIAITVSEPQFLIGQAGQTLIELERVLRIILNKKLGKHFYLRVDINDYRKKKVEHIKLLAKETADEVALTQKSKTLPPMSAYERRIVHMELSERQDVVTESQGEGLTKAIIVSPK